MVWTKLAIVALVWGFFSGTYFKGFFLRLLESIFLHADSHFGLRMAAFDVGMDEVSPLVALCSTQKHIATPLVAANLCIVCLDGATLDDGLSL